MNTISHLTFHHLGLAVRRPDEARIFVKSLGYKLGEEVFDAAQNVRLQMASLASQPSIEIIWPGDTAGPVTALTSRNPAGIIYHACYETDDIDVALSEMEKNGLQPVCISRPTPAILFGNKKVSFYTVKGLGLVEILEK